MSYTTERQPQGVVYCYTNKIREAMMAEIVAINDYSYHIANCKIEEINKVWHHIRNEEKEHYGMFLQLLREFDPVQYQKYIEVKNNFELKDKVKKQDYCSNYCNQIVLNNIRNDIKGELEAVVLYEQHIMEIPIKRIRDVFLKVIADEKEHLEELTAVVLKYDKSQYGPIC